ncbi:MAG TPA: T9SS type A sorting domain-containing protein, partial [Bacteroidia bacterium]|nr:T9SS type A sorting domain-containing protein [Bacteroidia bacterium]
GHVVSGYSMVSTGNEDALLISTDSSGNILWSKTYGGISTERAYTVQPSADGGYILGGFTGSFGSSPYDLYLIKTNNTGYSGCNENSSALSTFPAPFTATTPSPAVASGISSGNPSVVTGSGCLISTPCIATGTIDVQAKEFLLYPNPTSSSIKLIAEAGNYFLSIKNTLGETVLIKSVTEKEFSVDVKDFPSGIYFVSITDQKKNMVVKKFVKM